MDRVVFDFDGVIHSYASGWQGPTVIPDPPVPGIKDVIDELRAGSYEVVVVSARARYDDGPAAIAAYLAGHSITVDDITAEKPPAKVYVDDRGICFDGCTIGLVDRIRGFQTWWEAARKDALPE